MRSKLDPAERRAALRQVAFAAGLSEAALAALADIARPLQRPAGSLLQLEGAPAESMFVLVSGQAKVYRLAPSGRAQVLHVSGPGDHFNAVPMFDGGPCPATVEALSDVVALALPREGLQRVITLHPELALALLKDISARLRVLVDLVESLALHTVQGRLAALLVAEAEAGERGEAGVSLTQADLAARLGTVREMVGRSLRSFDAQGLIRLERGAITVVDREGLAALAQG